MADVSGTAYAVIGLKMPVVVPAQRSDPVATTQSHMIERVCQLFGAPEAFFVSIPVPRIINRNRHDLLPAMKDLVAGRLGGKVLVTPD